MSHPAVHVVINPVSGRGAFSLYTMHKKLTERGVAYAASISTCPDDLPRQVDAAVEAGARVVAVYGGDGTVSRAAARLAGTDVALAILPGGSANMLAGELGIPFDLAEAVALIEPDPDKQTLRRIDLAWADDTPFLVRLMSGMPVDIINETSRELKNQIGWVGYWVTALRKMTSPQPVSYRVTLDGRTIEKEAVSCLVANASYVRVAGGRLAPDMAIDDGKLDVFFIGEEQLRNPGEFMAGLTRYLTGQEAFEHLQGETLELVTDPTQEITADGEGAGQTPVKVRIERKALPVVVPADWREQVPEPYSHA